MMSFRAVGLSLAVFTVTLSIACVGKAAELPGGYSCGDLKNTVATYGAWVVLAAARQRGIYDREISQIRRQCKV